MAISTGKFFVLTLSVAALFGFVGAAASHGWLPDGLAWPLLAVAVLSPGGVAAWLTRREAGREGLRRLLAGVLRWRAPAAVYVAVILLPFAANAAALGVTAILGGPASVLPSRPPSELQVGWLLLAPLLLGVPSVAEELGWRGYALPRLQRQVSPLAASAVIGVVWAAWHVPLKLVAGSPQGSIPFGWYLAAAIAMSVVFTAVYNASAATLVPVVVLHAGVQAANVALPVLPDATGDTTAYLASVAVYTCAALWTLARFGPQLGADRRAAARRRPVSVGVDGPVV